MDGTYPCISIRQPWVWAIFFAGKDIENRDWPTRFRGRILIHAAKGLTRAEYEDCLSTCHAVSYTHPFPSGLAMPAFDELPRGCIFGGVTIADCVKESGSPWFFGKHGFVLEKPKPLAEPIPYKGALGIFRVPAEVIVKPTIRQHVDGLVSEGQASALTGLHRIEIRRLADELAA